MKRVSSKRVAVLLDRMTKGGGIDKVAKEAGMVRSVAWRISKDFPLWEWFRLEASRKAKE